MKMIYLGLENKIEFDCLENILYIIGYGIGWEMIGSFKN